MTKAQPPSNASWDKEKIRSLLQSSSISDRLDALDFLEKHLGVDTQELLLMVCQSDPELELRQRALVILTQMPTKYVAKKILKIALNKKESQIIRLRAIWALGYFTFDFVFKELRKFLQHDNPEYPFYTILSLIKFPNSKPVLPDFRRILSSHTNQEIRQIMAWAFNFIEINPTSIEILLQALHNDSDWVVRLTAAWTLGYKGTIDSVQSLCQALKQEQHSLTQRQIVLSVGRILRKHFQNSNEQTDYSEQIHDLTTKTLLDLAHESNTYYIRRIIIEVIRRYSNKNIENKIIDLLKDESDKFVRVELIKTLGKMGTKKAYPILKKSRRSNYHIVAKAAKQALSTIKYRLHHVNNKF
ncbi:MAG: HEAT repeat domain-containing protein [Asgard group archaeon]|nr:HEAT repeat domain-containing protein [Asgard group archaeon]